MYDMNRITHRLIYSAKFYASPPLVTTGGAAEAKARVLRVEVQDVIAARTFELKERHTSVTPQDLSERWCIGLGQATDTLKHITQRIVQSAVMTMDRRYRADKMYEKTRLRGECFTDTLDGSNIQRWKPIRTSIFQ